MNARARQQRGSESLQCTKVVMQPHLVCNSFAGNASLPECLDRGWVCVCMCTCGGVGGVVIEVMWIREGRWQEGCLGTSDLPPFLPFFFVLRLNIARSSAHFSNGHVWVFLHQRLLFPSALFCLLQEPHIQSLKYLSIFV